MLLIFCSVSALEISQASTAQDTEELVLPIRVHILTSGESENLNCDCTEDEIIVFFNQVNAIWKAADVRWNIESFVREEANNPEAFDEVVVLGRDAPAMQRRNAVHSSYPLEGKLAAGWNVFFINRMAFGGGVYNPESQAVLISMKNPSGDINPSILTHELGHALGLPHSQERFNLMAGRQPGVEPKDKIQLTPEQIVQARGIAKSGRAFRGRGGAWQ